MLIGMIPALSSVPPVQAQDECETFPMCVFLHPGLTDAYKPGFSHTLDTLWGTQSNGPPTDPGDPQTRQLFDNYLDYAILASASEDNPTSVGDLQFDFTIMENQPEISGIEIYVPPEFTFTAPTVEESVWTDLTNDYAKVSVLTASDYDPVAPGWTRIILGIGWWGSGPTPASVIGSVIDPGTYHVRLFGVAAPAVAGLYHFKIYYWLPDLASSRDDPLYWTNLYSLGAGNFPVIVVKDELNPAWVAVTVRTELYFGPPDWALVSGQVVAEGTTPEGRSVKAQAYWGPNEFVRNVYTPDMYGNGGAEYLLYLFGLAEGTYDVTAYAGGMVPKTTDRFTVLAGQSYHLYLTVFDSPDLFVTIYSKHGTGETPWHNLWQLPAGTNDPYADPCDDDSPYCPRRDILIELYNSDNALMAFWASDDMAVRNPISGSWRKWFGWTNRLGAWTGVTPRDVVFAPSTGLDPLATFASFHLVDNYDLLLNPRGYPGTRWDGHVPWDTADYVDGILNGAYTLEAFVTGYIMDEPDAYQRSFVISGIEKNIPFDLRRTNWGEVEMHMPSGLALSDYTTVVLTAEDANGGERASAAFRAPPGTSDLVCGYRLDAPTTYCPIVLEGKNGIFPNIGSSLGRGTSRAREATEKDYGLNPTASTHSAGAVALAGNPYTVKLYMADMAQPAWGIEGTGWYSIIGGDPQLSFFLCNTGQWISFTIRPAWLELFIRSVDFQVPAHPRPWTFPGSEMWITFSDETGEILDYLDPTLYGLIQDPGTTQVGEWFGWEIEGVDYLTAEGQRIGYGVSPYDYDSTGLACPDDADTCAGRHALLKVRYAGSDWTSPTSWGSAALYRALPSGGWRPTRLPPGQYTMDVHTHGYVLRRAFPVQVPLEGGADIPLDLIQGGQIRVIASFKHEAIKTPFTGFVLVEVLNENDELVGASIYGRAEPNIFTTNLEGGAYFSMVDPYWLWYDDLYADNMKIADPAQGAGFGEPYEWFPSASPGQRAMFSNLYYGVPDCPDELNPACQVWASWDYTTPIDANKFVGGGGRWGGESGWSGGFGTDTVVVDVYGFYWYFGDPARTWAGGWPTTNGYSNSGPQVGWSGGAWDSGLRGSDDIPNWSGSGGGKYQIKIYAFDYERQRMYAMGWPLSDISLPWGGAEDFYIDMNSLATLRGSVAWLDLYGNYRALPWAQIGATPGPDDGTMAYGVPEYVMWLPAGTHDVSVSTSEAPSVWGGPAELNAQYTVVLTDGASGGGDSRLDHTEGVPVPELPALLVPFGLLAALAASVWLLRKRNLSTPLLIK